MVLHAKTSGERGFFTRDWWLPPEKENFNWLGGDELVAMLTSTVQRCTGDTVTLVPGSS